MIKSYKPWIFLMPFMTLLFLSGFKEKAALPNGNFLQGNNGFALVELFTSEGCSSCPSADAVLERVTKEYPSNVYVLGFHVDYWNRLGWKDIYSEEAYTKRQEQYAGFFKLNSIYTPQVIINGKIEFAGSEESRLNQVIRSELKEPAPVSLRLGTSTPDGKNILVSCKMDGSRKASLFIALVQLAAFTHVKGGENEDRDLHHVNIVRAFQRVDGKEGHAAFILPAGMKAAAFKIIAFAQGDDFKIVGAAEKSME